ncbi:MAG: sigma-70 family RNA polymerase sigma factor [Eubacteriales bacterium]|nr:sigma-70 family RNA polymerase sigma factor [Eubacteriales bacterium]
MRNMQRLPGDEIKRLLRLWNETHLPEYRDRLVEAHLYIAEIIARKFSGRGVDYDDLYQVASLALFKAIGRYDPERGIQLSSFVTPGMVGEVKNYFRDKSRTIRPPRRSTELIRLVESARQELTQQLSRSPRVDEIAVHANLTEDEVLEGLEAASMQPVSLDQQTVDEDEDLTLRQAIGTEEKGYSEFENADLLRRSMDQLTPKQQEVIRLRFFENLSQREVAQRTGVSQMSVSRTERSALERLRQLVTSD